MIGVQLSSELFAQWGTYFYSPPANTGRIVYVAIGLVAVIFMAGRIFDIVTDSLIGIWSDRASHTPGKFRLVPIRGRRRPFIFWGSILMTVTGIAFWYPPIAETSSTNLVFGTVIMSLHWGFYTLAYIPILALSLDFARDEQSRIRLGTWIAVGMILGIVGSALLPGELIATLDPARQVTEDGVEEFSAVGYQRVSMIFAAISLFTFQFFIFIVKEPEDNTAPSAPHKLHQEILLAFRLPLFRRYLTIFFLFYIGILANQRATPYWVQLGVGGDESAVTTLGIPFLIFCLLSALACPLLIKRFSLKSLMIIAIGAMGVGLPFMYLVAIIDADFATKMKLASILYALKGVGLGMMYVLATPLVGQIVDQYARDFGERKEAVFNAMHAMMVKFAQVFSILLATQTMNRFGNSAEEPTGIFLVAPIASIFCFAAFVLATQYPSTQTTKKEN